MTLVFHSAQRSPQQVSAGRMAAMVVEETSVFWEVHHTICNFLNTVWNVIVSWIYIYIYMRVSISRSTPKWMVYNGRYHQNRWFGGYPHLHMMYHVYFSVFMCFLNPYSVSGQLAQRWRMILQPKLFPLSAMLPTFCQHEVKVRCPNGCVFPKQTGHYPKKNTVPRYGATCSDSQRW